ncbi:myosin light chain kinase 2, skeletal/cardiac muscle [Lampris incognitus]|uniref:myosin light chain kinase 2, skeletal/cardiac muscle n=1 Tax=Lampris incognitus TaxID=2546036 RepID=UPI0024B50532|nr:myosin light chain kinase 2, skeletal/cardiac muscle [Lampris incognitus]
MSSKVINSSPNTALTGDRRDGNSTCFDLIQNHIESLSSKMDRLINIQVKVLSRLDGMSEDIDDIEKDMENLKVDKEEIHVPPRVVKQSQAPAMGAGVREMYQEMSSIMSVVNQRSEQQARKLEGMEKLVLSMQQVIGFIGETVKSSQVMALMLKGPAARKASKPKDTKGKLAKTTSTKANKGTQETSSPAWEPSTPEPAHKLKLHGPKHFLTPRKCGHLLKDNKDKDGKEKSCLSLKGLKAQKKKKPPDTADAISLKKQILLLEEVQKLNRENAEKSGQQITPGDLEDGRLFETPQQEDSKVPVAEREGLSEGAGEAEEGQKSEENEVAAEETQSKLVAEGAPKEKDKGQAGTAEPKEEGQAAAAAETPSGKKDPECLAASHDSQKDPIPASDHKGASPSLEAEQEQMAEVGTGGKRRVTEEDTSAEDHKKSRVEEGEAGKEGKKEEEGEQEGQQESDGWGIFKADGVEIRLELKQRVERAREDDEEEEEEKDTETKEDEEAERYLIDTSPPPAAPFSHRIVSAKPNQINNFYTINRQEILGGGRFGQVHKCVENSSGLTFAAKIIKARSVKEKEVVKNEIQAMNQLDHASLIQLYAAYESRNDIILVLEYVDGGELFDRIIDENYTLMELDTVMFIRQICEGLQHMHKMYILHLDLKPENILCVSRLTNKIKIIDFGLARIYKPREKLKVNFGTPEFLAPEVINYDFVSFNTDMWSLGVITYMLLSGLCPFLGDDDNQTLNNILACQWNFEEEEFTDTSKEAKDFISKLLLVNKSWRMGASEALRHPWLCDPVLHHRLHTKRTMCKSRRSSCVPTA